ncbi:MAG: hypothetical protein R2849_03380 [Thermomicrobiales bacterium]
MPTRTAFMSVLVGKEHMANALALDSTGRNLNMIAGAGAGRIDRLESDDRVLHRRALLRSGVMTLPSPGPGSRGSATGGGTVQQMLYGFRYTR